MNDYTSWFTNNVSWLANSAYGAAANAASWLADNIYAAPANISYYGSLAYNATVNTSHYIYNTTPATISYYGSLAYNATVNTSHYIYNTTASTLYYGTYVVPGLSNWVTPDLQNIIYKAPFIYSAREWEAIKTTNNILDGLNILISHGLPILAALALRNANKEPTPAIPENQKNIWNMSLYGAKEGFRHTTNFLIAASNLFRDTLRSVYNMATWAPRKLLTKIFGGTTVSKYSKKFHDFIRDWILFGAIAGPIGRWLSYEFFVHKIIKPGIKKFIPTNVRLEFQVLLFSYLLPLGEKISEHNHAHGAKSTLEFFFRGLHLDYFFTNSFKDACGKLTKYIIPKRFIPQSWKDTCSSVFADIGISLAFIPRTFFAIVNLPFSYFSRHLAQNGDQTTLLEIKAMNAYELSSQWLKYAENFWTWAGKAIEIPGYTWDAIINNPQETSRHSANWARTQFQSAWNTTCEFAPKTMDWARDAYTGLDLNPTNVTIGLTVSATALGCYGIYRLARFLEDKCYRYANYIVNNNNHVIQFQGQGQGQAAVAPVNPAAPAQQPNNNGQQQSAAGNGNNNPSP